MKIATWNVNSLRVRLPQVLAWLKINLPSVLAVQEIKMQDAYFPTDAFYELGYYTAFSGQKTYNGMALFAREPLYDVVKEMPGFVDPARRVLAATCGLFRIVNVYVPNGQVVGGDKYQYKLQWMQAMRDFLRDELQRFQNLIVLGDFNVAPEDRDVHDPSSWQGQVLVSAPEREALQDFIQLGLVDCYRLSQPDGKDYTWWDYRLNAFKRNLGLRIDHILASTTLSPYCTTCMVDKIPRTNECPSDHAPLIAEFTL